MEKGSCSRVQGNPIAKPLFTRSATPPQSMWLFSSAITALMLLFEHTNNLCVLAEGKETF